MPVGRRGERAVRARGGRRRINERTAGNGYRGPRTERAQPIESAASGPGRDREHEERGDDGKSEQPGEQPALEGTAAENAHGDRSFLLTRDCLMRIENRRSMTPNKESA